MAELDLIIAIIDNNHIIRSQVVSETLSLILEQHAIKPEVKSEFEGKI